jgi:hypothetical protein
MTPLDLIAYLILGASCSMVLFSLVTRIVLATYQSRIDDLRRIHDAQLYSGLEESDIEPSLSDDD